LLLQPLAEIRWETDYEIADAQTIANAVIRHGDDESSTSTLRTRLLILSRGIIHLVTSSATSMHRANLRYRTCLLITHSRHGLHDVLTEMQKTVHMPGGSPRRAFSG